MNKNRSYMWRPFSKPDTNFINSFLIIFIVLCFLVHPTFSHLQHVDHSDDEIESMSLDDLLHVEHDLRDQNTRVDKHITSLSGRLSMLRSNQEALEKKQHKAGAARDYEVRQRHERERELERAHASLHAKQEQVQKLTEEAKKLRERIHDMSEMVASLNNEKHRLEKQYAKPSFQDALIHDAQRAGTVPGHVANKTIHDLLPTIEISLHEAELARKALHEAPATTALFTSFIVYVLALSLLILTYRSICMITRRLTLARALLTIDLSMTVVWFLVFISSIFIGQDPLYTLSQHHRQFSLVIQLILITALAINVLIRCLTISTSFDRKAVMELITVIFVTQHYYQGIWVPIIFDTPLTNTSFSYVLYMFISGGLVIYRARAMDKPVEKLRLEVEEVDGIMRSSEWIKDRIERAIRYCEEWLTSGVLVYDDKESLRSHTSKPKLKHKSSFKSHRHGHR